MEVQTSHFENGEWVTRTASLHEILARAEQQQTTPKEVPGYAEHIKVPKLGILSRTVLPSPVVRFILPARIRHRLQNDVVFVGEDFVQIKSIHEYGHLQHVATKNDFKGRILAARVFGDAQAENHDITVIKQETKDAQEVLPPQVIVLTLDVGMLVFLWAQSGNANGSTRFHQRSIPLPEASSPLTLQGTYLAIDPKCRAIAVGAYEERFIVYRTRTMSEWREVIRAGRNVTPIVDESTNAIQGSITHMEFLYPSSKDNDENHVILLFAHRLRKTTKLSCYDWDHRSKLLSVKVRAERISVDPEDRNPSLLIPLQRSSDFLLISDRSISSYKNILTGSVTRDRVDLEHDEDTANPGSSKRKPVYVQWERMRRNPGFSKEVFYIAREDGRVIYVQIAATESHTSKAGYFNCSLSTAFASIDVPHDIKGHPALSLSNADVLIGIGPDSDGQLCKVGSWAGNYKAGGLFGTFDFIESIPNWAPACDSMVSDLDGLKTGYERNRSALFIANGREPYGAVSEMRRGLNALVHIFLNLPFKNGVTGIWIVCFQVDDEGRYHVILLICLPPNSYLFHLSGSRQDGFDDGERIEGEDEDWNHETLAACWVKEAVSVQVTHEAIILREWTGERLSCIDRCQIKFPNTILAAAIRHDFPVIIAAIRQDSDILLRAIPIQGSEDQSIHLGPHMSYSLPAEPTCVELFLLNGVAYVLVGTTASQLMLFAVHPGTFTLLTVEVLDSGLQKDGLAICESAVLLTGAYGPVIVCGLRSGHLFTWHLDFHNVKVLRRRFVRMGSTPARVIRSEVGSSTAFVACCSDLCQIQSLRRDPTSLEIDSIWFTDRNMPGYQQSAVTALAQLPLWDETRNLTGYLFSISGDRLLMAQFDHDVRYSSDVNEAPSSRALSKAIPRKLITGATPTKLLYLKNFKHLLVATMQGKEEQAPPSGYRKVCSSLKLLSLDDNTIESKFEPEHSQDDEFSEVSEAVKLVAAEYELLPYERVYCTREWECSDSNGNRYAFLIVGTGIQEKGHRPGKGRRLFLKVRENRNGVRGLKLVKKNEYDQPIYSIAFYSENRMLFTSGDTLYLEEYHPSAQKWSTLAKTVLRSAGVHITTTGSCAHVSLVENSLVSYGLDEHPALNWNFETMFTDSISRNSTSHLILNLCYSEQQLRDKPKVVGETRDVKGVSVLALVADKQCSVAGLIWPAEPVVQTSAPTVFEAGLSRSVTRLHRANIRPPWRRPAECQRLKPAVKKPKRGEPAIDGLKEISALWTPYGVVVDDIIGTATDGAVFSFSILLPQAFKMLKLIENLIKAKKDRDEGFHVPTYDSDSSDSDEEKKRPEDFMDVEFDDGSTGDSERRRRLISFKDVEPQTEARGPGAARKWHVDGDLIEQWLDLDEPLRDLVREGVAQSVAEMVAEWADGLVRRDEDDDEDEMVDWAGEDDDNDNDGGVGKLLDRVEGWVREVMCPVL